MIGLVELDWFYTLSTIEPDEIAYTDYVTAAKELVPQLVEEGCELIVALTHMRVPNDTRLAEEVPEIHLILGGHDHHYELTRVGQVTMLKSGSDFREFSQITVRFSSSSSSKERESPVSESTRPTFEIEKHEITSNIEPDEELQSVVDEYMALVEEGMNEEMGSVECDLEGRFCEIRTRETNLGNFITDIMRRDTRSDIALLNSGTLRSDTVHESGVFKMRVRLLFRYSPPFPYVLILKYITHCIYQLIIILVPQLQNILYVCMYVCMYVHVLFISHFFIALGPNGNASHG